MKTIAVTLGDPAGVGPEVVARALVESRLADTRYLVIGPPKSLAAGAERMKVKLDGAPIERVPAGPDIGAPFGKPGPHTGHAAFAAIELAAGLALDRKVDAIVTAPVSKRHIVESGVPFVGHTEYLAARSHVKHPVMLFVADRLRVALVTIHLPLRKVPAAVTVERVVATVRETARGLKTYFGVLEPRIAVAGLNPHAGEGGLFGREEIEVLAPAVDLLRREDPRVAGPFPADTIFRRAMGGEFDAVVAMYHDQALGPVKTVSPDAVNVTLGLPFVRTSVDHGTAFDIAGQGKADWAPMVRALKLAREMSSVVQSLI